ncbi:3-oxoacyl-[acyl-carrier-protein] reductase [Isachenkonia alkalipeptolytica]|uniref:3-oxoacyl-[acyl-carrier-protein] reductase n=1 Tax=Isachenkonia alkalipeptolytica TaxID=2565777 RepID=A0AA43XMJ1_9CLOT|nr:3-oxoacyl-[acyl-carrier-protein] reductase [Isachenkonia alkalipeptolytica]NBG89106.1 3-oxoacyl-[acyl-carrier-protein] reductase [Isachenkonia alkalipeptolytica]
MRLQGKNALVTGGSRGIGKAIALELARQGANVAINFTSNEERALEVVKEIEGHGVKAVSIKGNVTETADVEAMIRTFNENFDTLDVLVNNAGVTKDNLLIRMKEEDWDGVMDVNLKGVFLTTKAVARKMMKQKKGKIINLSSVVGVMGNPGQGNYCASKAGVIGFTKSIAKELGGKNISVNAIAPGFIETDMTEVLSDKAREEMLRNVPLKRPGKPEDVARLVSFLSSEDADYITGQVIHVDGGMVM